MTVRLSDLPLEVRQRVEAEHGVRADGRTRDKPARAKASRPTRGRCATSGCGWVGSDRHDNARDCRKQGCDCFLAHVHETGHTRIELETTDD